MDGNVHVLPQNDLLRALHTTIRDRACPHERFVLHSRRVIRLLLEAALNLLPVGKKNVVTPVGATYEGLEITAEPCAVSVIRAGDAMEIEFRELCPAAPLGKILVQRDKQTKLPRTHYSHLPADIAGRHVLLLEPMLATAGSALAALDVLAEAGVREDDIILVTFLSSPEGLRRVRAERPGVRIITSSVEDGLDGQAFMVPGIGDFGDRFFGTTGAGTCR